MNISKILHDSATQYFDMAKIAKIKSGDIKTHDEYLNRAYFLEKEAALKMESNDENNYWQYMLIRSAAWLAFKCKKYEDALNLAKWGLHSNPPEYERQKLEELWKELKKHLSKMPKMPDTKTRFYGILSSADIDDGKIKIRKEENGREEYQIIFVSKDLIQKVGSYLGIAVEVDTQENEKGVFVLQNIKPAA